MLDTLTLTASKCQASKLLLLAVNSYIIAKDAPLSVTSTSVLMYSFVQYKENKNRAPRFIGSVDKIIWAYHRSDYEDALPCSLVQITFPEKPAWKRWFISNKITDIPPHKLKFRFFLKI